MAPDAWPRHSRYPEGHFIRALGPIGDKSTENEVLLLEHDIPHSSFSEAVMDCLPSLPWVISAEDERSRVDLRGLNICSVDPPGCTDIDDALHCFQLPNGNYEVGVHIADVSHFIRPGTAIDKEAADRGTTVYLTDRRIGNSHCLKITQNVAFEFLKFGIFHQFFVQFKLTCLVTLFDRKLQVF